MATTTKPTRTTTLVNGVPHTTTAPVAPMPGVIPSLPAPVSTPTLTYPAPAPTGGIASQSPFNVNNMSGSPLTLTTPAPQTAATGANGYFAVQSQALQSLVQAEQDKIQGLQNTNNQNLGGVRSIYQDLVDQPQKNEQIYSDLQVDDKLSKVNNYASQIEAEQTALNHQIDKIKRTNPLGVDSGQAQGQIDSLTRESVSKQADIAVLQSAAVRDYDAAAAAADRKVAAETEGLKTQLDARKFFYQENKDDLTKAEDKAWQVQLAQGQAELDLATSSKKAAQNLIIEAASLGAPDATLKQAQAIYNQGGGAEQIAGLLGPYSLTNLQGQQARASIANTYSEIGARNAAANATEDVDTYAQAYMLGQVPLTQIPQKIRGQVLAQAQASGTSNLTKLLNQYKETITGLNFLTANTPTNKTAIQNLKGQITAVYKQQQQLGTLDNGVQTLVDKIIPDPSKPSISSLSNKAQIAAIDNFIANNGGAGSSSVSSSKIDPLGLGI